MEVQAGLPGEAEGGVAAVVVAVVSAQVTAVVEGVGVVEVGVAMVVGGGGIHAILERSFV